jgi:hypothetical protein
MTSAREALHNMWLEACRSALDADYAATRNASPAQAATLEHGLPHWCHEMFSHSGLGHPLCSHSKFLALFVLWARYGDYAGEALIQVYALMSEEDYLKHLYAGKPWTDVDVDIEKETVRKPLPE